MGLFAASWGLITVHPPNPYLIPLLSAALGFAFGTLAMLLNRMLTGRDARRKDDVTLIGKVIDTSEALRVASHEDVERLETKLEAANQTNFELRDLLIKEREQARENEWKIRDEARRERLELLAQFEEKLQAQRQDFEGKHALVLAQNRQLYALIKTTHPEIDEALIGNRLIGNDG